MGNDGGSIPKRRELVRSAAGPPTTTQLKESRTLAQEYAWTHCALSRAPLSAPLVADAAGRLYNKDAVLEVLLASSAAAPDTADSEVAGRARRKAEAEERGVRALRDVVEVRFEVEAAAAEGGEANGGEQKWVCPVSRRVLGPGAKAVYLVPCGHAFSGAALRELEQGGQPGEGGKCAVCNEAYESGNVIPIAPTEDEDVKRLDARIKDLQARGLTHSLKKAPGSKKRKKNNGAAVEAADEKQANGATDSKAKAAAPNGSGASNGIKNSATASLAQRVLEEQNARKRARTDNENVKSLFSSNSTPKDGKGGNKGKNGDFMTRGFSIPANAQR